MKHTRIAAWMLSLTLALALMMIAVPATLAAGGPPLTRGAAIAGRDMAREPLTEEQAEHLVEFWLDEHKALAMYESVIDQFGEIQPFVSIATSERQHIAALERVFGRYGLALPELPVWSIASFDSPEATANAAAQAEIDNAALYESWTSVFTQVDILRVMENLGRASLENHLPAFQAFAAGELPEGCDGDGTPLAIQQSRGWTKETGESAGFAGRGGGRGAFGPGNRTK
jgi:hypothetical protein